MFELFVGLSERVPSRCGWRSLIEVMVFARVKVVRANWSNLRHQLYCAERERERGESVAFAKLRDQSRLDSSRSEFNQVGCGNALRNASVAMCAVAANFAAARAARRKTLKLARAKAAPSK